MRLAPPRWSALGPFLLAGFLVQGGFRLLVRPGMLADLAGAEAQVAALASAPGGRLDERFRDPDPSSDLEETEARVATLARALATPTDGGSALQSLHGLAAPTGVRLRRFAPEPEYRLDDYRGRAVSVTAEGEFFELLGFFRRVSRLPRLVLIQEFELEAAPEGLVRCRFVAVSIGGGPPEVTGADPEGEGGPA